MNARRAGVAAAFVVLLTATIVGSAGGSAGAATRSDPATPGIIQCPLDLPACRVKPHPGQVR
ncbi:hypothetical protein [Virgisporangium aurantiacum]|uniref:Uncharacterized protein n=1 Tax=Virgisporangium aurantiacum TaxID=175570 RepID=A0A8J3ZHV2_9ACTN|nr:hypothetical protein [Virgisporangium aurantiacum]GIJ64489.1 hypothetical protein Vau01_120050 [Virgisporangium aurantiacum]